MILLYVFFVAGIFLLNRCVDLSSGAEQHAVAPRRCRHRRRTR